MFDHIFLMQHILRVQRHACLRLARERIGKAYRNLSLIISFSSTPRQQFPCKGSCIACGGVLQLYIFLLNFLLAFIFYFIFFIFIFVQRHEIIKFFIRMMGMRDPLGCMQIVASNGCNGLYLVRGCQKLRPWQGHSNYPPLMQGVSTRTCEEKGLTKDQPLVVRVRGGIANQLSKAIPCY